MEYRTETDSLGDVQVPADRYYGAQTSRALEYFRIGTEKFPREFLRALGMVKLAAARAHTALGTLPREKADFIAAAAREVMEGRWDEHFPLSVWQSGSGTQTHMNANEVIARRAGELAGPAAEKPGTGPRIHPNDDVNRGQSTNDVFPTAMHVAAVEQLQGRLLPALAGLEQALTAKAEAFRKIVKLGRTHLMDATPVTLGQEFSGYAAQLGQSRERLGDALPHLRQLALGGTAVGTGLNAPLQFAQTAIGILAEISGLPFCAAPNRFTALAAHDTLVELSGSLKCLAISLFKIANDLRLLASGPRGGLGEIALPDNEPGSSIMPGKVNPTQCEALAMVCIQVMGNDTAITFAGAGGQLELNTYKPVILVNLLSSLRLLSDACESFARHCVSGIQPCHDNIRRHLDRSLMLVTALSPHVGYDHAAKIARTAHLENLTLREAAVKLGFLTGEKFDALVRPERMLGP